MATDAFQVLKSVLRYLSYWYEQDNVEEVAINRPDEICCVCAAGARIRGHVSRIKTCPERI